MSELAGDYQTASRMRAKRQAIELPDLTGKSVLDVGCDHGFWSKLASDMGAARVLGLDRGREVRGQGFVDIVKRNRAQGWPRCEFEYADVGKEWPSFGCFDVVLAFAVYHHLWSNCGDHPRIWRWFREQTADDGLLIWDGPLGTDDPIVAMYARKRPGSPYDRETILAAAGEHFRVEVVGPALYRPTREVLRCTPL